MKKSLSVMAASLCVAGLVACATRSCANGITYNIGFNSGGWSAIGQIDVTAGVASSGYLDVTFGPTTVDYDYLAVGIGVVQNNNGDNLPYGDNLVDVNSADFVDQNGLLFLTAPVVGWHSAGAGIYLSADQFNGFVPNLNGYGNTPGFGWNNPNVDGTATITPIPDSSTVGLAVVALVGLFLARRKIKA